MRTPVKSGLVFLASIVMGAVLSCSVGSYANRESAINATKEWGRLAAFPDAAKNVVVTTEGNMFTRAFRVSFSAPREEIARWIDESPGLRETQPQIEGPIRKYNIKPGGGAQRAEVVIDNSSNQVKIYVAWS